jgi:hypothetical protein
MVYYFYIFVKEELVQKTYTDINKCRKEAIENNQVKFRDTLGGEYFL